MISSFFGFLSESTIMASRGFARIFTPICPGLDHHGTIPTGKQESPGHNLHVLVGCGSFFEIGQCFGHQIAQSMTKILLQGKVSEILINYFINGTYDNLDILAIWVRIISAFIIGELLVKKGGIGDKTQIFKQRRANMLKIPKQGAIPSLRLGGKQAYLLDIHYRKIITACSIEKTAVESVQNTTLIAGYFDGISF